MVDISFNIACKELKIAQIAQLNQLFQLLRLICIYGNGFSELSRVVMRRNVNNDVSKYSPIAAVMDCIIPCHGYLQGKAPLLRYRPFHL